MDVFSISNIKLQSIVKAQNRTTGAEYVQYGRFLKFYQLIYVIKGEAEIVFNDTAFTNKPGTIVLLPAGPCSGYHARIISDEDCIAVFFQADFPLEPSLFTKSFAKNAKLPALFEKLYQIWLRKEQGYYNQCMSLFYAVLAEMELAASRYIPCSKEDKLSNALTYIHAHYADTSFPYDQLHRLCGISYTYFKKLFKERFSVTPTVYVRSLKIQRACELLSTGKFSIAEVAGACGFWDVPYFSKVFKAETGVPPSKYTS